LFGAMIGVGVDLEHVRYRAQAMRNRCLSYFIPARPLRVPPAPW
jgi:hypothetical protein